MAPWGTLSVNLRMLLFVGCASAVLSVGLGSGLRQRARVVLGNNLFGENPQPERPVEEAIPAGYLLKPQSRNDTIHESSSGNWVTPILVEGRGVTQTKQIFDDIVDYQSTLAAIGHRKLDRVQSSVEHYHEQIRQHLYQRDQVRTRMEKAALECNEQLQAFYRLKDEFDKQNLEASVLERTVREVVAKYSDDTDAQVDAVRNIVEQTAILRKHRRDVSPPTIPVIEELKKECIQHEKGAHAGDDNREEGNDGKNDNGNVVVEEKGDDETEDDNDNDEHYRDVEDEDQDNADPDEGSVKDQDNDDDEDQDQDQDADSEGDHDDKEQEAAEAEQGIDLHEIEDGESSTNSGTKNDCGREVEGDDSDCDDDDDDDDDGGGGGGGGGDGDNDGDNEDDNRNRNNNIDDKDDVIRVIKSLRNQLVDQITLSAQLKSLAQFLVKVVQTTEGHEKQLARKAGDVVKDAAAVQMEQLKYPQKNDSTQQTQCAADVKKLLISQHAADYARSDKLLKAVVSGFSQLAKFSEQDAAEAAAHRAECSAAQFREALDAHTQKIETVMRRGIAQLERVHTEEDDVQNAHVDLEMHRGLAAAVSKILSELQSHEKMAEDGVNTVAEGVRQLKNEHSRGARTMRGEIHTLKSEVEEIATAMTTPVPKGDTVARVKEFSGRLQRFASSLMKHMMPNDDKPATDEDQQQETTEELIVPTDDGAGDLTDETTPASLSEAPSVSPAPIVVETTTDQALGTSPAPLAPSTSPGANANAASEGETTTERATTTDQALGTSPAPLAPSASPGANANAASEGETTTERAPSASPSEPEATTTLEPAASEHDASENAPGPHTQDEAEPSSTTPSLGVDVTNEVQDDAGSDNTTPAADEVPRFRQRRKDNLKDQHRQRNHQRHDAQHNRNSQKLRAARRLLANTASKTET